MGQWLGRIGQKPNQLVGAILGGWGSIIGLGLLALPADAGRLQFWRFNPLENRLEFTTDETVKPRVQLIPNPVRLVVDLPGVRLDKPTLNQAYSAAVRSIRVGQFDGQTARIVVELSPGYTVDPQQVKVQGLSPSSWTVDLPNPQVWQPSSNFPAANEATPSSQPLGGLPPTLSGQTPLSPISAPPSSPVSLPPSGNIPTIAATNTLEDVLLISEGVLLKTRQTVGGVQVSRISRKDIVVDVKGVVASAPLVQNDYKFDYHGIQRVSVRQLSTQPPVARVTLRVNRRSPDWLASSNTGGGVLLLPQGGASSISDSKRPTGPISLLLGRSTSSPAVNSSSQSPGLLSGQAIATLQNIALGGSQLLIQADRPIYYSTGWDGPRYRVIVRGAQWSPSIRTPQIATGSPLSDLSVRQDGPNVIILATPAAGVRMGAITRVDAQTMVLSLNRDGVPPSPVVIPSSPSMGPSVFNPPTLSQPNGRRTVVIDPGHGGTDVGAIGIGGLRETNITLPVSLEVARLLQQQGLQVYLTRSDESREVDLPPRVALAERVRADVFVSIHANSINLSRPDVNGAETYYAPGSASGAELGRIILNSIIRNVNISSRGMHPARFYVIRKTSMPATLVEMGFVTGAEDAPKLGDPNFQRQMAAAIAQGIIEFLNRR